LNNAATIIGVGKGLGASDRDLVVALMTAMQESTLRNLNYGDGDSLGLFQQRNAWGSAEDRTTPSKAARMFFLGGAQGQRGLLDIAGRDKMSLAQAAQAVQVSAYPDAYAKWQTMAMAILGGTKTTGPLAGGFGSGINMAQFGAMAGGGSGWKRPAGGPVTSEYGMRVNPVTGAYRLHAGIDLGAPGGSPIYAARGGTVISAGWNDGYGNYTIIDHGNGIRTAYAHQSRMAVHAGQAVAQGQVIGNVGTTGNSTGNHLHFEYMKNGQRLNPRQIIPQFRDGGYTFSTGLAELHPKETVLSAPLTQDLHEGLGRFAKGENAEYNLTIDLRGSNISQDVDIERAVEKVMQKKERRVGVKRKIGDR
jgi:murein DD-endopeptidase MepM/ murein hydrolase activator NlpD